jgi:hypothetical protein
MARGAPLGYHTVRHTLIGVAQHKMMDYEEHPAAANQQMDYEEEDYNQNGEEMDMDDVPVTQEDSWAVIS